MAEHNTQITSILAYQEILESLGRRQVIVYRAIRNLRSCSNTEISKYLSLPINTICPRVFELRKKGVVVEDKKGTCKYTMKTVIFWKVRERL